MSGKFSEERIVFPFTAVVDQDLLKLALILNAINPKIGGLLVRGEKGSGKSTVVRALADLLPEIKVVKGCPFNCNPEDPTNMCDVCREKFEKGEELPVEKRKMKVVTLPIGATEDRVIGSLDIERALKEGVRALQPGILAEANQNILYVDEINLLPDHIVDDILDAAASGWNIVEREGISIAHPSRFILVGTMNPEEGELRPQLLDRLPLSVSIRGIQDEELRVEVIKRNLEFAEDPLRFRKKYEEKQRELRERIMKAIEMLPSVRIPEPVLKAVAKLCLTLQVDGHRPDIVIVQTARTLAAFQGRTIVEPEDINVAAKLALGHRTRRGGFEEPATYEEIDTAFKNVMKSMKNFFRREGEKYVLQGTVAKVGGRKHDTSPEIDYAPENSMKKHSRFKKTLKITRASKEKEKEKLDELLKNGQKKSALSSIGGFGKAPKEVALKFLGGIVHSFKSKESFFSKAAKKLKSVWREKISKKYVVIREGREKEEKIMIDIAPSLFPALSVSKKVPFAFGKTVLEEIKPRREKFDFRFDVKVKARKSRYLSGKRALAVVSAHRGRIVGYETPETYNVDIALEPTLKAAVIRQGRFAKQLAIQIEPQDLRTNVRMYKAPITMLLVLDLSESMLYHLKAISEAVFSLHRKAYRYRDRVGLIVLQGEKARIAFHPTTNINIVARKIAELKAGGSTPLADGLLKANQVLTQELRRNPDTIPIIVLVSDGLANVPLKRPISPSLRDKIPMPAQADVIAATLLLARKNIPIVVINPLHLDKWDAKLIISPTHLLIWLAQVTRGRYYGFKTEMFKITLTSERMIKAIEKAINSIITETKGPFPIRA